MERDKLIPNEVLARAEEEIRKNYREIKLPKFRGEKDFIIRIFLPNIEEQNLIADYQSRVFNDLLATETNMKTKKEMSKILKQRGIWTDEDDALVESLRAKMNNIEIEMLKEKGKKNFNAKLAESYKKQYEETRNNLIEKIIEQENYFSHTIDKKAETKATLYKAFLCVKDKENKQVWKTIEELGKENNNSGVVTILTEANFFWSGLSREVLDMLPEKLFEVPSGASDLEKSQEVTDGKESIQ